MKKNLVWIRLLIVFLLFSIHQIAYSQCDMTGPIITGSSIDATCGQENGSIFLSVAGDNPPFTYLWDNGSTDQNNTNLSPGFYCVTVTDAIGCTESYCISINTPSASSIDMFSNPPSSPGASDGEIDLTVFGGTPPFSYQWSNGSNTEDLFGLNEGTYCVTVTDSDGCSVTSCVDLFSAVNVIVEGPEQLCIGECGIYTAYDSGGADICIYEWTFNNNTSTDSNFEVCPVAPGLDVVVLFAYDCNGNFLSEIFYSVQVINSVPLEIVSTSPASCPDNNTTSACDKTCANSTISYIVPGSQGMDLEWEVLGAESYEVDNNLVTVNWGNPGTGEINVSSGPTAGGGGCALKLNCAQIKKGQSGIATAFVGAGTPPFSYLWSNGQTGTPISNLNAGTYSVTVTDATGITETCEVVIDLPSPGCSNDMEISSIQVIHPSCSSGNDGGISVNAVGGPGGGYSYLWSPIPSTSQTLTDVPAGEYCVTITDSFGCTIDECFMICEVTEMHLNAFEIAQASFPGNADGAAGAQAFGGTPPYEYLWATGDTGPNLVGLPIGSYSLVVTDANGCTISTVVNITYNQSCPVTSYIYIDNEPSTCTSSDGSVTVNTTGTTSALEYIWSDGANTQTRTDLMAGVYCVTVVDTPTNCSDTYCVELYCNENITTSGCMGLGSLCIDIIEEPQALFSTDPIDVNGIIEICRGESVTFHNESTNAENYVWELGDGYSTSALDVTHAYTQSGVFDVLLIARNECFCIDTTSIKVLVSDDEIPEIECVGTVCESETQTYTTTADCGVFNWSVSTNGTISAGGGTADNFVTVDWGAGPEGEVTLQVSSCTGNYCANPTSVSIPILMDGVFIEGPAKVCPGEIGTYMIPQWSATEYVWSASPYGEIKSGQGSNTVTIKWNVETAVLDPQWVHVEYNNCFLQCSGESTKDVNITPDFYLAGPIDVCENSSSEYAAFNEITETPVACNWSVLDQDGNTFWTSPTPSVVATIDWPSGSGKYTLTASAVNPDDYCSDDYTIIVAVIAGPPPVNGINGQNSICPGEFYTYEVDSSQPNVAFNWEINNGGVLSENNGDAINVQWGASPPYELTVTQTSTAGLACTSQSFTMTVDPISSISLDGPNSVCIEGNYEYTAPSIGNATYDWTISPANAGTVLAGQGSDTISIIWNIAGAADVNVSVCGANEVLPVTVFGYPDPTVLYPDSLCENTTGLVSATSIFSSYSWRNESGIEVSSSSTTNLSPGYYELVVTNSAGCEGQTSFSIHELPSPVINITTPGLDFYCIAAGFPIPTLYALNTDEGYTYEWYQNGSPLGVFADTYTPTGAGSFYVVVNDINGCSSFSNTISIVESCGGGGGPPAPGVGCSGVDNVYSNGPTCPHGFFLNTSTNYVPGSVQWNFDDPASGAANFSNLENPEHFFPSAGFYGVQMAVTKLTGGVCILHKPFEVPAQANFDAISTCPGLPVEFEDISTFTPGTTITNYAWEFGDPASGALNTSNLQDPEHVYSSIGTYNVTLTITAQTGCTSTFSKTVDILTPPTASYQLPDISCAATALAFNIDMTPGITSFEWNFDDTLSGAANTSRLANTFHAFSAAGTYDVQLKVNNIYGCSDSISMPVLISTNDLAGDIDLMTPICEGNSTTVTAPPGGTSWIWSDGSTTESFERSEASVFEVTITNDLGCLYVPPSVALDIIAEPEATIKVTEYNEYGQPADCFFDGYILCEGEDVFLSISGAGDYSYTWSSGGNGDEVIYDEDHAGTLPVGDHEFEVTVTDNVSGCTSVEGPFSITVNPVPTDIMIISAPTGPICEQTLAALTVSNPDPQLTYLWSTGEYGNTITASTAGEYFVRGISSFGCEGESNIIEIYAAPDIQLVPDGCHMRCSPDTICLPNIPDVVAFQWYLNDVAIPAPEGTDPDFRPTESGAYSVELFDINGCNSLSNPFSIDLLALDTSSLQLGACDGGSVEYGGEILLPGSVTEFTFTNLLGCDSMITVTVVTDLDYLENVDLSACEGSSVIYGGEAYFPGTVTTLNFVTPFGCDSVVNINVAALPTSQETLNLEACTGTTVLYAGVELAPGSTTDFTFVNQYFCDSTVTVIVFENQTYEETVSLSGCEGSTVSYEGVDYPVGTNEVFNYSSISGCDSTIFLNIAANPTYSEVQNLSACAGTNITLPGGLELEAGTDTTLLLLSQLGCDSIVQIIVDAVDAFEINVDLSACEGESAIYEGTPYPAGTDIELNFVSQQGCDSTIFLFVETLPVQNGTLQLAVCSGLTVEYAGLDLLAGTTTDVVLENQFGCDSTITVTVDENLIYYEQIDINGCNGETVIYEGVEYAVPSSQELNYLSSAGCDSTILLVVEGLPLSQNDVELFACPGGTVEYVGDNLPAGTVTEYTFPNQFNCDSIVEVTVSEYPTQNETVMLAGCGGETVIFGGVEYPVGTQTVITLVNQFGCDSIINLNVQTLPSYLTPITLEACEGETVNYNGLEFIVGTTTEFELMSTDGCDSLVVIEVLAFPTFDFEVISTDLLCWNSNEGEIEVIDLLGGTEPFSYSLDGINYQSEQNFSNVSGDDYTVYVQDANGCELEETVSIPVTPPIEMGFNIPTIGCNEDSVLLQSILLAGLTDSISYEWRHGLSGTVIPIYDPGSYVLDVSNQCETQSFEIDVAVEDGYRDNYLYIPNAFSPNGDGNNDFFKAYPAAGLTVLSYELHLFDRWGNTLYTTTDVNEGWDGVFLDEAMNPGVYVWWLRAKVQSCRNEIDLFKKGDVTIMK